MPVSNPKRRQTNWEAIYAHNRKKGPRRYHRDGHPQRAAMRKDPVTRNPFTVHETTATLAMQSRSRIPATAVEDPVTGVVRWVELGPVRMKLPKLRRCV